jgi:hypothetical protein
MNILYFLFFINRLNYIKHTEILYKNNANLDFKDNETSVSFKYYKKILEERKERKRHKEILY